MGFHSSTNAFNKIVVHIQVQLVFSKYEHSLVHKIHL